MTGSVKGERGKEQRGRGKGKGKGERVREKRKGEPTGLQTDPLPRDQRVDGRSFVHVSVVGGFGQEKYAAVFLYGCKLDAPGGLTFATLLAASATIVILSTAGTGTTVAAHGADARLYDPAGRRFAGTASTELTQRRVTISTRVYIQSHEESSESETVWPQVYNVA